MTDTFHSEVSSAVAKDEAEYQEIMRQIKRDEKRERAQRRKQEELLRAMVFAATGPSIFRHVDGPAHRKRYEKELSRLGVKP